MRNFSRRVHGFVNDTRGGETIEYALILGLVIVAAIAVIGAVGTRVVARWTSTNSSFQ
jgi:pilus assembly protein Flp/PilA